MPRKVMFTFGLVLGLWVAGSGAGDLLANPVGPSRGVHRAALLIGNASYDGFELPGVAASLAAVEQSLMSRGFAVTRHMQLDQKGLDEAVTAFARSAPTGGVAVVYYIGLAAHVERFGKLHNLLRPVGAEMRNDGDYRGRGRDVAKVLTLFREQSGARAVIVCLDASWASPIRPDHANVRSGLAAMTTTAAEAVVFGGAAGQAVDLPGRSGPTRLATALARHAATLDDSIVAAVRLIAKDAGDAWASPAPRWGLGPAPRAAVIASLQEGSNAGQAYVNSIGMAFRWCPPGSFTMGSDEADSAATRDRAPVQVTLTRGFWMGEHEMTQREYDVVRGRTPPAGFTRHKNAPFWGATDAKSVDDFCKRLTEMEHKAGRLPKGWAYACPTEAQWEYACRAGATGRYAFGDDARLLGRYGNFADAALRRANPDYHWSSRDADDGVGEALAPVGRYLPNAWGLRDMHGNVAEIVADHLTPDRPGGADPLVRLEKNGVTQIRGGAWCSLPLYCESSFRNALDGRDKRNYVGFRVVLQKVDGRK